MKRPIRWPCLLAIAALLAYAAPVPAVVHDWRFAVSIDGVPVGEHRYAVDEDGAARHVTSDARFRVRLFIVDAYSWQQHVEETWRDDCLTRLDSRTVEQGRVTTVSGHDVEGEFTLTGPQGTADIGRCPMTFAWWNPNVLARHALVNAQTGAVTPVQVEDLGLDGVDVRGHRVDARRFRVRTPRNTIEVWYAGGTDWVAMRTRTRDGHVLAYRLE